MVGKQYVQRFLYFNAYLRSILSKNDFNAVGPLLVNGTARRTSLPVGERGTTVNKQLTNIDPTVLFYLG